MNPSSNPLVMLLDIFRAPTACFLALYQRSAWGWQTLRRINTQSIFIFGVPIFRM